MSHSKDSTASDTRINVSFQERVRVIGTMQ